MNLKIIKPQVLTKQNKLKEVDKLTSNLVSRSKSIFYMDNIHIKYFKLKKVTCFVSLKKRSIACDINNKEIKNVKFRVVIC